MKNVSSKIKEMIFKGN
jgi:hypothetical protein